MEDELLYRQQLMLSAISESSDSWEEASLRMSQCPLAGTTWQIESWDPAMMETAVRIAQQWKDGG